MMYNHKDSKYKYMYEKNIYIKNIKMINVI